MMANAISQVALISTGIPRTEKSFIDPRNRSFAFLVADVMIKGFGVTLYAQTNFNQFRYSNLREITRIWFHTNGTSPEADYHARIY